jgi:hypothetical protein
MVCEHRCQSDSDCPAPDSGTGVATCLFFADPSVEDGTCVVSCDNGETCQDGFQCRESRGGNDYATWPRTCVGQPVGIDYGGPPAP